MAPTSDVSVPIYVSDSTEALITSGSYSNVDNLTLIFNSSNWSSPQTVTAIGQRDNDSNGYADGDQNYWVILMNAVSNDSNFNGANPQDIALTNIELSTVMYNLGQYRMTDFINSGISAKTFADNECNSSPSKPANYTGYAFMSFDNSNEIRDLETAEIAIQSALSGHLVLSTLHTNDALSSFTRLIDMGLEPFLVAAPLKGVQAQRLVRRLCVHCSKPCKPRNEVLKQLSNIPSEILGSDWRIPEGCNACHGTGYSGRLGIYQMVAVDDAIRDMIVKGATLPEMRLHAEKNGSRSLYQDGLVKASNGLTSIEEISRVITADESL